MFFVPVGLPAGAVVGAFPGCLAGYGVGPVEAAGGLVDVGHEHARVRPGDFVCDAVVEVDVRAVLGVQGRRVFGGGDDEGGAAAKGERRKQGRAWHRTEAHLSDIYSGTPCGGHIRAQGRACALLWLPVPV